jgi:hypothetical protein
MHGFFVKRKHEMRSSCRSSIAQVPQTLISRHPWCCRHSLQWIEHYTASTKTSEVRTLVGEVFQRIWNRSITESLEKSARFVLASSIILLLLGSWDSLSKAKKKGRDLKLLIVYCLLLDCLWFYKLISGCSRCSVCMFHSAIKLPMKVWVALHTVSPLQICLQALKNTSLQGTCQLETCKVSYSQICVQQPSWI